MTLPSSTPLGRSAPAPSSPTSSAPTSPATGPSVVGASLLDRIAFDASGLVPAIAQDATTAEVLMLAWMNRDSLAETLATGQVTYWSRSRQALWRKGATSGQMQRLVELRLDCDGDALLLLVEQTGVACHTGRRSCFYLGIQDGTFTPLTEPEIAPEALYGQAPGHKATP